MRRAHARRVAGNLSARTSAHCARRSPPESDPVPVLDFDYLATLLLVMVRVLENVLRELHADG